MDTCSCRGEDGREFGVQTSMKKFMVWFEASFMCLEHQIQPISHFNTI